MSGGGNQMQGTNNQRQGSVNVQTTTQPVLVVPLNVGSQQGGYAPPAEYIPPPGPGAPPTFAVDTREHVMNAAGFEMASRKGGNASRSASPRSAPASRRSSGGSTMDAMSAPNVKVNVVKQG